MATQEENLIVQRIAVLSTRMQELDQQGKSSKAEENELERALTEYFLLRKQKNISKFYH